MSDAVRVRRDTPAGASGAVVRLSLEQPPLNVLTRALNREIAARVREASADPGVVAIVLDGGAGRGFSAGVEVADHTPEKVGGMLEDFHGAIRALWSADCPTLAAIHGFALGGGLELAIACDLVIAEDDAKLGFPEIKLGCYPPVAAALLPARIGWANACELALSGENLTPARAVTMNLINRACPPGSLATETDRLLAPLLEKSPAVLRETKRALREGAGDFDAGLARIERRYLGDLMKLADAGEGIAAFMEKRAARWGNR